MSKFYLRTFFVITSTLLLSVQAFSQNYHWAKPFGNTNTDIGYSIAVDDSANVYTTGAFQTTVDFNPGTDTFNMTSFGSFDIFVCKYDKDGNFKWAQQYGSLLDDRGYALTVDGAGNVYVTGYFKNTIDFDLGAGILNLTAVGADDMFILKLTRGGAFVWAKQIGGSDVERGKSIVADHAGNVITTGFFNGSPDFDPGSTNFLLTSSASTSDIFISKLNMNGEFVWAKKFGVTGLDEGHDVALDAAGNIYATGEYNGTVDFDPGPGTADLISVGVYDMYVVKLDPTGAYQWARSIGGDGYDVGKSIALDATGNVYTTGLFQDACDFDPGAGVFKLTADGGGLEEDIFVSKLNPSGNFLWAKRMGKDLADRGASIAVDAGGNSYTTGIFTGAVDFDPGTGTDVITSYGSSDAFICKLDASGNYAWAKHVGGPGDDDGLAIAVDGSDNVVVTGEYKGGATDFDPGTGTVNLNNLGDYDGFVLKLGKFGVGIRNRENASFAVYPNPTHGTLRIINTYTAVEVQVVVTDLLGKKILDAHLTPGMNTLDVGMLPQGMYLLTLTDGEREMTTRFVKE
jgi:hypothetical protein